MTFNIPDDKIIIIPVNGTEIKLDDRQQWFVNGRAYTSLMQIQQMLNQGTQITFNGEVLDISVLVNQIYNRYKNRHEESWLNFFCCCIGSEAELQKISNLRGLILQKISNQKIAANTIQKYVRSHLAHKSLEEGLAAKTIQKYIRGHVTRKSLENQAAATIQKYIRAHLARKPLLSLDYTQYLLQCEKAKKPGSGMSQAEGGNTTVYLPEETPDVVLKKSGRREAIKRFHQMQSVRTILDAQNSSHLIIPKASLCQEFLVEERLPINIDTFHNMHLYLTQPELFDEAVRELTRLFSNVYLTDLISRGRHPLGHLPGVEDEVRYDNLPLYIVKRNGKKEGCIGLIDLEQQNKPCSRGFEDLARIFPFHVDIIKEEADKSTIMISKKSLKNEMKKGKRFLQLGFTDHINWLKQKETFDLKPISDLKPFEVSPQRMHELTSILERKLLDFNKGLFDPSVWTKAPQDFLIGNPEVTCKELAPIISSLIIGNVRVLIEKELNKQLSKPSGLNLTEAELVSLRSPVVDRLKLFNGVDKLILKSTKTELGWYNYNVHEIAQQLACTMMIELVRGGEIFFWDPAFYTGGHDWCWIRY